MKCRQLAQIRSSLDFIVDMSCAVNAKKVALHIQVKQMLCRQEFSRSQLEMPAGVETITTGPCWDSLSAKTQQNG